MVSVEEVVKGLRAWKSLNGDQAFAKEMATAADLLEAQASEIERLRAAINWLERPFVDAATPESELRQRVTFCLADAARAARLSPEAQ